MLFQRITKLSRAAAVLTLLVTLGAAAPALAKVPATVPVAGALTTTAGGVVADGTYGLDFALYAADTGGAALWSEANVAVTVKGGSFAYALGTSKPLAASLATDNGGLWLGVAVGGEPELARRPVGTVFYAMAAQTALDVQCSGCISAAELAPEVLADYAKTASLAAVATTGKFSDLVGGPDLSGYAKTADLGAYAKSSSLAKVAATGAYADLVGGPDLSPYAKSTDLAAYAKTSDLGAFAKATDLANYAKATDLTDFVKAASLAKVAGSGKYADLTGIPAMAQLGTSCGTGLVVRGLKSDGSLDCVSPFDVVTADSLSKVSQGLISNKYTEVVASTAPFDIKDNDPTGSSNGIIAVPDLGNAIDLTISVDITTKDASGLSVRLYDPSNVEYILYNKTATGTALKFTVPNPDKVASGDLTTWIGKNPKGNWQLAVADTKPNGVTIDGQVNSWSIRVGVWSDKKVAINGDLILTANTQVCTAWQKGGLRWNAAVARPEYCDGKAWIPTAPATLGTQTRPAASCKAILDGGDSKGDGLYWLQLDASLGAFQTYCDMTTAGGGWTLVMSLVQGEYKLGGDDWNQKWQQAGYNRWADKSTFGDVNNASRYSIGDYKNSAYFTLKGSDMLFYHVPSGTGVEQWRASSVYTYHTSNGFLATKGPTVQGIYATSCPLTTGGGAHQCLIQPVTYDTGDATAFATEQCPNNRGESERGFVTFGAWNSENYAFAFCPVKQNGPNVEHSCVGGNGATGGTGAGGWGDMREWYYDGSWCMSTKLRTAAIMMLVR